MSNLETRLRDPAAHYVYFLRAGSRGPIRIGVVRRPSLEQRIRDLRAKNAFRLVGLLPWTSDTEADLVARFAHARLSGGWFEAVPELLDYIGLNGGAR